MKIISFLGFNPSGYQETTYVLEGKTLSPTKFFQTALVEFYQPSSLHVLLTPTAKSKKSEGQTLSGWEQLQQQLEDQPVQLVPVPIPETHQPEDVWTIFSQLTEQLDPEDQVVFDITHGMRSLPVIALVALVFLKSVKKVEIKGLVYGAFDVKQDNQTPVFDLMPIVSLLDWTTATDQFLKTGNGKNLADLLKQENKPSLSNLGHSIEAVSQGLQMLRPIDVLQASHDLTIQVDRLAPEDVKSVAPVTTLLQEIRDEYGGFGVDDPTLGRHRIKEALIKQLKMIGWYFEKGKIVQCLSLAREWLPSLLCWHFELDPMNINDRDEMEFLLNGGKKGEKYQNIVFDISRFLPVKPSAPSGKES